MAELAPAQSPGQKLACLLALLNEDIDEPCTTSCSHTIPEAEQNDIEHLYNMIVKTKADLQEGRSF